MADFWGWLSIALCSYITAKITQHVTSIKVPLWIAFLVRVSTVLIDYYISPIPESNTPDYVGFEQTAWLWAQDGFWRTFQHFDIQQSYVYSFILSIPYSLVGRSLLMAQIINATIGILIVFSAYKLANILWGKQTAYAVTWLTALFPALILYSAITAREVWIILPFMIGLISSVMWFKFRKLRFILISLGGFSISTLFHGGMLLSVLSFSLILTIQEGFLFLGWLKRKSPNNKLFYLLLAILILSGIVITPYVVDFLLGLPQIRILSQRGFMEAIEYIWQDRSRGEAAYLINFELNTLWDFLWLCSLRTVYFLFLPFPWMVRSPIDLLGVIDALIYWLICCSIIAKLKQLITHSGSRSVLVITSVMVIVFAIGTSNYGTALRHRAKFAPALFSLSGIELKLKTESEFS